jgi:hypothetical protein
VPECEKGRELEVTPKWEEGAKVEPLRKPPPIGLAENVACPMDPELLPAPEPPKDPRICARRGATSIAAHKAVMAHWRRIRRIIAPVAWQFVKSLVVMWELLCGRERPARAGPCHGRTVGTPAPTFLVLISRSVFLLAEFAVGRRQTVVHAVANSLGRLQISKDRLQVIVSHVPIYRERH